MDASLAVASFGDFVARELVDVTADLTALDSTGWWAVRITYEGDIVCLRFADVRRDELPGGSWVGPSANEWSSSMTREDYLARVSDVRELIAQGSVYQVNICRVLSTSLPDHRAGAHITGLHRLVRKGNPAPYGGVISVDGYAHANLPDAGVQVVSASPELYLGRRGPVVRSRPIKGTARAAGHFAAKDEAENIMIVDLVRNDLGVVCETGSVHVPELLVEESHPGLVHLVSTVTGNLREECGWSELIGASFPPGSVSGAPKSSAVKIIEDLETAERGPYCGAIGWVDADHQIGELAVGIRTFWREGDLLHFGTGAGITWGSDPGDEWDETEVKAAHLLQVAAGSWEAPSR